MRLQRLMRVQSSTDSAEDSGEERGERNLDGQRAVYVNQILQILPGKLSFVLFESEAQVHERGRENGREREREREREGERERVSCSSRARRRYKRQKER